MNWLAKIIYKLCIRGNRLKRIESDITISTSYSQDVKNKDTMNMSIIPANGGKIITFTYYDEIINKPVHESIYVIHSEDNLGEKLAELITAELLRKKPNE